MLEDVVTYIWTRDGNWGWFFTVMFFVLLAGGLVRITCSGVKDDE